MSIRVLLADDHAVVRSGLRALLGSAPEMTVVGEASDGVDTLRLAAELEPDVVVLDLSMPGPGGIEVTRQLAEQSPEVKVLILTIHEDEELVREAIHAGAAGFVVKRAAEAEIIFAVRAVLRGDLYVHSRVARGLLREKAAHSPAAESPLSQREIDVLRLLARGCTNSQVAESLYISVRTVEHHRASITAKLGLSSRADLFAYAQEHQLLGAQRDPGRN